MRIALISTSEIPSRTANSIQVMKVGDAFKALGHNVKLHVPRSKHDSDWDYLLPHYGISNRFAIEGLRSYPLLRRYDFAIAALVSAARWHADVLYIWTLQAAALASMLGYPTIVEMHDRPPGRMGPILFKLYLWGRGALRLLPITHSLRLWLEQEYEISRQNHFARVAPMGVNLEAYASLSGPVEMRKSLDLTEAFTAGYAGHLYPGRGLKLLFELAQRNPAIQFLWIGGENETVEQWRRRSAQEGLENLNILGFVENARLPAYQAACDVLLMPYQTQISISSGGDTAKFASPMKVFEYLASGRAIISSDLPVLREVLNESNAVLLPPGDVDAWHQALGDLMRDDDRRNLLGQRAREDARQYSWIERAEKTLEGLPWDWE